MSRSILQITGPRSEYLTDEQWSEAVWKAGMRRAERARKRKVIVDTLGCLALVIMIWMTGAVVGGAFVYQHLR